MTTTEAIVALVVADPTRIYTAEKSVCSHTFSGTRKERVMYSVAIQPGVKNEACSLYRSGSFEQAVADAIAAMCPKEARATPNNE